MTLSISKAVFAIHPIFHCPWSSKKKTTFLKETRSYKPKFNRLVTWNINNRVLLMVVWKLHKKYSNAVTNQTLKQL